MKSATFWTRRRVHAWRLKHVTNFTPPHLKLVRTSEEVGGSEGAKRRNSDNKAS